jgi:hypothetical protein
MQMNSRRCHAVHFLLLAVTACAFTPSAALANFQQSGPETPPERYQEYFPNRFDGFAFYLSEFLARASEPSLVEANKDPTVTSYRLDYMAFSPARKISIRLVLNSAKVGQLVVTEESGTPRKLRRTERAITDAERAKFREAIEKATFWSLPTIEAVQSSGNRKPYKVDPDIYIFEGVETGKYHVVYRRSPDPGPFVDLIQLLMKEVSK